MQSACSFLTPADVLWSHSFSSFISSVYFFYESLIPFLSTILLPDAAFKQFDAVISCLSFTICFAVWKISFCCLRSFKLLAYFFFFSFAEEITLFAVCIVFLYSLHASIEFFLFQFPYFIFYPYCFNNLFIPSLCFLMSAWAFRQSAYNLCCLHHYICHLLPVFIYTKAFPFCFLCLISDHTCVFLTFLFLLELLYTHSLLELLMPSFLY